MFNTNVEYVPNFIDSANTDYRSHSRFALVKSSDGFCFVLTDEMPHIVVGETIFDAKVEFCNAFGVVQHLNNDKHISIAAIFSSVDECLAFAKLYQVGEAMRCNQVEVSIVSNIPAMKVTFNDGKNTTVICMKLSNIECVFAGLLDRVLTKEKVQALKEKQKEEAILDKVRAHLSEEEMNFFMSKMK